MEVILLAIIIIIIAYTVRTKRQKESLYKKTEYYSQTKTPYKRIHSDKGRLGEFFIYEQLKTLDGYKRFLFNIYIPKENGDTTEIDVILLHESGIYVFESKNYSGWIFGTETQRYWTQTLPSRGYKIKKNKFLNPVIQNEGHLKWLQHFLKNDSLPFYSYIVFSNRCLLRKITLTSRKHCVINRYDVFSSVQMNALRIGTQLANREIDALYEKLYPLTQIDEAQKRRHIETVQQNKSDESTSST